MATLAQALNKTNGSTPDWFFHSHYDEYCIVNKLAELLEIHKIDTLEELEEILIKDVKGHAL